MSEFNKETQVNGGNDGAVEAQPAQAQQPVAQTATPVQQQVATQQPAQPNWFKRNWKKLVAGAAAVAAAAGTGFAAYAKGKKAGAAGVVYPPQPDEDDYSLNPNL